MRPQLIAHSSKPRNPHTELVNQVWRALNNLPGVAAWKLTQGVGRAEHADHAQWFGLVRGASDVLCCARGRFVAIECKTGSGRERLEQEQFREVVLKHGGIAVVVRSVAEAISAAHVGCGRTSRP